MTAAVGILLASAHAEAPTSRRVIDATARFWPLVERLAEAATGEQAAAFRADVIARFPELYSRDVLGTDDSRRHRALQSELSRFHLRLSDLFDDFVGAHGRSGARGRRNPGARPRCRLDRRHRNAGTAPDILRARAVPSLALPGCGLQRRSRRRSAHLAHLVGGGLRDLWERRAEYRSSLVRRADQGSRIRRSRSLLQLATPETARPISGAKK